MNKYPKRGGDCEHTMDCMWGVGRLFADRIRRYQDECKAAGVPV